MLREAAESSKPCQVRTTCCRSRCRRCGRSTDVRRRRTSFPCACASRRSSISRVTTLDEPGPDLERDLRVAVLEGQLDAVRVLLDAGAEPDRTTFYGDSLIDMARDRGHEPSSRSSKTRAHAAGVSRRPRPTPTIRSIVAAEAGDLRARPRAPRRRSVARAPQRPRRRHAAAPRRHRPRAAESSRCCSIAAPTSTPFTAPAWARRRLRAREPAADRPGDLGRTADRAPVALAHADRLHRRWLRQRGVLGARPVRRRDRAAPPRARAPPTICRLPPRSATSIASPRSSMPTPRASARRGRTGGSRSRPPPSSATSRSSGCCSSGAPIRPGPMRTIRRGARRCTRPRARAIAPLVRAAARARRRPQRLRRLRRQRRLRRAERRSSARC